MDARWVAEFFGVIWPHRFDNLWLNRRRRRVIKVDFFHNSILSQWEEDFPDRPPEKILKTGIAAKDFGQELGSGVILYSVAVAKAGQHGKKRAQVIGVFKIRTDLFIDLPAVAIDIV